jgi:hypothetical protein
MDCLNELGTQQSLCRDIVGGDTLSPTQLEGAIKDVVAPCGGKVSAVMMVGNAAGRIALDERLNAIGGKQQESLAMSIVNVKN